MARGFTLLELVVVMALMALAAGLVVPAAQRGLDAARERGIGSDLSAALSGLPMRAFRDGAAVSVDAPQLRKLVPDLPSDWSLVLEQPLHYTGTGVASGGLVRLQPPGRSALAWRVLPVSGEVERVAATTDR